MNNPPPEVIAEWKQRWEAMNALRASRRSQEEIIEELSSLIKDFRKDSFIPYLTQMSIHIDQRDTLEVFKNLMSPMKQFVYLTDLFFSVENGGDRIGFSKDDWEKITNLLNEIEMTYFADIGFFNDELQEDSNLDKISVSLPTFLNYFGNAQLSYDEQTLERLERNCGPFDEEVKNNLGFSVNDAIKFSIHLKDIVNRKYTDCHEYFLNQDKWEKLVHEFGERGLEDPKDWKNEPELALFNEYTEKPGFIFMQNIDDIYSIDLPKDVVTKLIDFLTYDESLKKGEIVYYADSNPFFDTPLIKLDKTKYLCPQFKFLIESFYNRINSFLSKLKKEKYTQLKNQMLETKVTEVFRRLFGKDVLVFESYYVDNKRSEQDLLIMYKGYYFIIEIKDTLFRAPMRDPIKAFDKINSDFKKAIQYGYDQCVRVENKFEEGKPFEIYDAKTRKSLYKVLPNRAKDYFSIIVTQFKYGNIQTNLDSLLRKEEDAVYPWSVCIDDLEAFILGLLKLKKGMAKSQFINYLTHREAYNEHLLCGDELELCGYFMNNAMDFEKFSTIEETFSADPRMSQLFDAEYRNGLGFKNELDIDAKRHQKASEYQKKWEFDVISGKDFMDKK